jgi:hypothetical protein
MRKFRTAAATLAVTGLAALGAAAASGGVANAATNVPITQCNIPSGMLGLNITPTCTANPGTINNPTQITISADTSVFSALGQVDPNLGVNVSYNLSCAVNGATVTTPTQSFTVTSAANASQIVNLQSLVGSPAPSQCTVQNLTATSTAALTTSGLVSFTFGATATGDNGVPGTLWAQGPGNAAICADDTANGNAGSHVQAFQCENDLADQWLHLQNGQFVHNGDCLTSIGNKAVLAKCEGNPDANSNQVWTAQNPGAFGTLTSGGECLTAPTSGMIDGTQLTVVPCVGGNAGQMWRVPDVTPL